MTEYIFLMHSDSARHGLDADDGAWGPYIAKLQAAGCFAGGSSIGGGVCVNKTATHVALSNHIVGFIRVQAEGLEHAKALLLGNPVFEAGGTVEIRELPPS